MKTNKKVIYLSAFAILVIILSWSFTVFKNRYSNLSNEDSYQQDSFNLFKKNKEGSSERKESSNPHEDDSGENTNKEEDSNNMMGDTDIPDVLIEEYLEVTHKDCDNDCSEFEAEKDKKYCQQVCGLIPIKEESELNCSNLEDLERDYCLKDLGIIKKDFQICNKILDTNIRKTCSNRITEDILSEEYKKAP